MQTAYAMTLRVFGETNESKWHFDSGIFPDRRTALNHFMGRAETFVYETERREGDFLGELFHGKSKTLLSSFRIQKTSGVPIKHFPECKCRGCHDLMRMCDRATA